MIEDKISLYPTFFSDEYLKKYALLRRLEFELEKVKKPSQQWWIYKQM